MIVQIILVCIVIILLTGFLKGQSNEQYWKKRGVKFYNTNKLFGPFWEFMTQDRAFFEIMSDIHKKYKDDGMVGLGSAFTPLLFLTDPKIIHHVYQTDFPTFYHRGIEAQPGDTLADNVLFMNGKRWKLVRQSMTPLFTAMKLKNMYYILDKSARDFVRLLDENPEKLKGNSYDTLTTFCSAAISASVFGITTESIFNSPFLKMARKTAEATFWSNLRFSILSLSPWLFRLLGLSLFREHEDLFISAIKKTIRKREAENVKKHDFADLCVSLQKDGKLKDPDTGLVLDTTDELLAAQGFFFFIAGVEPSATALFCTLMELGLNPHYLQRLHEEIDSAFEKYNDQISYEVINQMKYADMVLNEGLRMYPPIAILRRQSMQDTVLPGNGVKIEKDTNIVISIYDIHRDPVTYPEPDSFIPERFETKDASDLYLPFGKGNRTCIGERYARMQVKSVLVHLLRHYSIKTVVDGDKIKFYKKPFQVLPSNVDIHFIKRDIKC